VGRFSECDEVARGVIHQSDFHETRPTRGHPMSIPCAVLIYWTSRLSSRCPRFGTEYRQEPNFTARSSAARLRERCQST
jgi:hypothetical protein